MATEKRNMSMAVRSHTEAGKKQVGDNAGVASIDEKSRGKWVNRHGRMEG
jgi:hypothetical protein